MRHPPTRGTRTFRRIFQPALMLVGIGVAVIAHATTIRTRDGRAIEGSIPARLVLVSTWTHVGRESGLDTTASFDVLDRSWTLIPGADVVSIEPGAVRVRDGARRVVQEQVMRGRERSHGAALRKAASVPDTGTSGMRVVEPGLMEVDVPALGDGRETLLGQEIVGIWTDEAHGGSFEPFVVVRTRGGEERIEPGALAADAMRGPSPLRMGALKVRRSIEGRMPQANLDLVAVEAEVTPGTVARPAELGYDAIRAGWIPNRVVWVFQVWCRGETGIGMADALLVRHVRIVDEKGREFAALSASGHGINDQGAYFRFVALGPPDSRKLDVRVGTGRAAVELP